MSITLTRFVTVVAAAAVIATSAGGASLIQPQGQPGRGRGPGEGASVEASMKSMNRALRQLRGSVGEAAKKDECLRLVGEMQQACLAAKRQPVPGDVLKSAKDDAGKAHLAEEYRHELIVLMRALLDLEEDIAAGKTDSAKNRVSELVKLRDHAHSEMGIDEKSEEGEKSKDDQGKDKKNEADKGGKPNGRE